MLYAVQRCTPSTNDRNTALQNDRIEPFFGFDGSLQKGFLSPFLFSMDQSPISKTICPSKINVTVSIGTFWLRASPARAARWARCSSRPQPPSPGSLAPNRTLGCLLFLPCLRYDIFRTFHYIINVFAWISCLCFGFLDWTTPAHWFCCFVAISLLGSRCFFRISTVHF